jgi:cytosine/adenosine deaminase-related metal-dependent hydrolase
MEKAGTATRRYHQVPATEWDALRDRLTQPDPGRRVLLRGAVVISMDPEIKDLAAGDVLIERSTIKAVGPDLSAAARDGQAITIEMGGMILIPGLVDGHRHCWQNQFRRLIVDADLPSYMATTHGGIALHYRPEDMYAGDLVTMLGAIDSGVTSILDFSHNTRTPAHSDAVFQAYREAGIRAVHASAPPNAGAWDEHWPQDLTRLRDRFTSALTSVRLAIDFRRPRPASELIAFARANGLSITFDGVLGPASSREMEELGREGLLAPDVTVIHATDMADVVWQHFKDAGIGVTLAPTSDEQIGLSGGTPPIQKALDFGIRPSLSVDVEISLATDMFSQMRCVLATQRMQSAARRYRGETPPVWVTNRDVLEFATIQGARHIGLGQQVGSLTPGKQADLVAIRAEDVNNLPLNNAIGTVVQGADTKNVDLVWIAGEVKKWRGALLGLDLDRVRSLAEASRDYLAAKCGWELDVFGLQRKPETEYDEVRGYLEQRQNA